MLCRQRRLFDITKAVRSHVERWRSCKNEISQGVVQSHGQLRHQGHSSIAEDGFQTSALQRVAYVWNVSLQAETNIFYTTHAIQYYTS